MLIAPSAAAHAASHGPSSGRPADGSADGQPQLLRPFVEGSFEHAEVGSTRAVTNWTAATTPAAFSLTDIPSYGWMRSIALVVTATGGTGAAAVYQADAPWSAIASVALQDTTSRPIVGPFSGYDLFLVNLCGGYAWSSDPTLNEFFTTGTTAGNFQFMLRIPVEITARDGVGVLANMSSEAPFKVALQFSPPESVYSTLPTVLPTNLQAKFILEAWAPPYPVDLAGHQFQQQPPNNGTVQYWSKDQFNASVGEQGVRLKKMGNLIRQQILVFRNTGGARSSVVPPTDWRRQIDSVITTIEPIAYRRMLFKERTGIALPTGVVVDEFCHDLINKVGDEMRGGYFATAGGTDWRYIGVFGAAGTVDLLTNDIAAVGDLYAGVGS